MKLLALNFLLTLSQFAFAGSTRYITCKGSHQNVFYETEVVMVSPDNINPLFSLDSISIYRKKGQDSQYSESHYFSQDKLHTKGNKICSEAGCPKGHTVGNKNFLYYSPKRGKKASVKFYDEKINKLIDQRFSQCNDFTESEIQL